MLSRPAGRRAMAIGVTLAVAVAAYWLVQPALPERPARAVSILLIAAGFWATGALPLFATAFVAIGLEIVFLADTGGLAIPLTRLLHAIGIPVANGLVPEPIDAGRFLAPLAQDIVILFLAGFLLSAAMSRHGADRVLAVRLLRPFAASPRRLVAGLLCLSAFLSMWMSNTATAAMMLSLLNPILAGRGRGDRLAQGLTLAVAFGANIGGIATPIGTPPNAIAYGALNAAGYRVTFLSWMLVAVPLMVLLLSITAFILLSWMRRSGERVATIDLLPERLPLTPQGAVTLAVLAIAVGLWLTSGLHGVRPGAVGLLAVAALSALGAVGQREVNGIDWSILIVMWGGLSLSVAMDASGLTALLAGTDVSTMSGGLWTISAVAVAVAVTLSTVMSNTAAAALLVPLALALSLPSGEQVAMLVAFGCSLAMALPVSTPPNAVAYATGRIELATMRRLGVMVSTACVGIVLIGYRFVLPWIF